MSSSNTSRFGVGGCCRPSRMKGSGASLPTTMPSSGREINRREPDRSRERPFESRRRRRDRTQPSAAFFGQEPWDAALARRPAIDTPRDTRRETARQFFTDCTHRCRDDPFAVLAPTMKRTMVHVKPFRIYIDTSVLGGCFDVEFSEWSNGLVRNFRAGQLVPVLSDVTAAEVADAPARVRELHQEMLVLAGSVLVMTPEVGELVVAYEARKILTAKYAADMRHIALATIATVDSLVSWNFKHIVRLEKIRLFNAVNVELGYPSLNIRSPREVTTHEGT